MYETIFLKTGTLFLILGFGLVANKVKLIPTESLPYLITVLMSITTPCMLITSLSENELTDSLLLESGQMVLATAVAIILSILFAILLVKPLRYKPAEDQGVLVVLMTASNTAFMGIPVAQAVFGGKLFYLYVLGNAVYSVYTFGLVLLLLDLGSSKTVTRPRSHRLKSMLLSAPLIGTYIGIFLLFTGIKLPGVLSGSIGLVGQMTGPLSMLVIGAQLGDCRPLEIMKNFKLMIVCLIDVIVIPAFVLLLLLPLPFPNEVKLSTVFLFTFPAAVVTSALAQQQGKNYTLMASGVSLTTLFSLVTLPVWTWFLQSHLG